MGTNTILPFGQGVGANVQSQADYLADAQRTAGNQPGTARADFVNKALLQANAVAAGVAQYIADMQAANVGDTLTPAQMAALMQAAVAGAVGGHGQCRLVFTSGSAITLLPCNGNRLIVAGLSRLIPSAGVALAPTGLTANAVYYIYAYMNGATLTLEASTTAHSREAATGVQVKTTDATRTLVGMVRIGTGPAFVQDDSRRFVLSYFNRRRCAVAAVAVSSQVVSSTDAELSSTQRCQFLTWADEGVAFNTWGSVRDTVGPRLFWVKTAIDNTVFSMEQAVSIADINDFGSYGISTTEYMSEGFHYTTVWARQSSGSSGILSFDNTAEVMG